MINFEKFQTDGNYTDQLVLSTPASTTSDKSYSDTVCLAFDNLSSSKDAAKRKDSSATTTSTTSSERVTMKLVDSISDLNAEFLFDSCLFHICCQDTLENVDIEENAAVIAIPLSSRVCSNLSAVDTLKQNISRTGETVFKEEMVAIFAYIVRNLRFSKNASIHFFIDARQMSTDDQKDALDIILYCIYNLFLAFPDQVIDVRILVGQSFDWLIDLVESFAKKNNRFSSKIISVVSPAGIEAVFDTDAQAKCRKFFNQWLDFRQVVEQLSTVTSHVAGELDSVVEMLTTENPAPITMETVDKQIEEHQKMLKTVFRSEDFLEFKETAESDLLQLIEISSNLSKQYLDCNNFCRYLQNRHKSIQEQLGKVVCMSKMRVKTRLEMKQVLRITSEIGSEIQWLNTEACEALRRLETPVLSSDHVEAVATDISDFSMILNDHLVCVDGILSNVHDLATFNTQAEKKLTPLAELLRMASENTKDRLANCSQKIAINGEIIGKLEILLKWSDDTLDFLNSLDIPCGDDNQICQILIHSASKLAEFRGDNPDPTKSCDDYFPRLFELSNAIGNEEIQSMLEEAKAKYEESSRSFHNKEEQLDNALKQLLNLTKEKPENDQKSVASNRSTIAQLRFQRRILRSVSLLEQTDDEQNLEQVNMRTKPSSSTGNESHQQDQVHNQYTNNNNRRSVAVLKALDEINEHLHDLERSTCDNCSPPHGRPSVTVPTIAEEMTPEITTGASVLRVSSSCIKHSDAAVFTPPSALRQSTEHVVMRRRASAAFSSSTSSAALSCSSCRKSSQQQQNTRQSRRFSYLPQSQQFQLHSKSNSVLLQNPQCLQPMSPRDDQIVGELLQTECDYIASLRYVIDNYLTPLTQDARPHPLQGRLNIVFGNIESLLDFHENVLLPELELCRHNLFLFATCFLRAEQDLSSLYVYYNTNKSRSDRLLSENANLFSSIQVKLGHKLDVGSYLLKPVQRLAKYSQFLRQLLITRSSNDVSYNQLLLAERMLSYILRHGNDLLLLEQLRGYDFALAEQGQLLRQDRLMVERKGRSRKLRHLFLFEEILVISKIHKVNGRGDFYEYKESVKICDIGLTPVVGKSGTKFEVWFRRPNSGYRYLIKAENSDQREAWTNDIEELLWRQAMMVKERRNAQFVSMGIGLRGLITLQPSLNNISSRTVNMVNSSQTLTTSDDSSDKPETTISNCYRRPASVMVLAATESDSLSSSSPGGHSSSNNNNGNMETPRVRMPNNNLMNKRPYSWLSSTSSGTHSSMTNTPAPTPGSNANSTNGSASLISPLLSTVNNDRLLIPKLITLENGVDMMDMRGKIISPTPTAAVQHLVYNKPNENAMESAAEA